MKIHLKLILLSIVFSVNGFVAAQNASVKIALLKYNGGGDWYANPTALPNLIDFCNKEIGTNIYKEPATVEVGSIDLFNYPFVHMTGHGNVLFNADEAANLRLYLESGGFLHIDDNYGMDESIRRELKKVFPNQELSELPFNHPVYHQEFEFKTGVPKIHEHDNKPPQAFGLYIEDRLVVIYTFETDLGDGWESPSVHNDPERIRQLALKMGANMIHYAFHGDKK